MPLKRGVSSHGLNGGGKGCNRTAVLATWMALTVGWALMHFVNSPQRLLQSVARTERRLERERYVIDGTAERTDKVARARLEVKETVELLSDVEEAEKLRIILREVKEGGEAFEESDALDKFWRSMSQTGSTDLVESFRRREIEKSVESSGNDLNNLSSSSEARGGDRKSEANNSSSATNFQLNIISNANGTVQEQQAAVQEHVQRGKESVYEDNGERMDVSGQRNQDSGRISDVEAKDVGARGHGGGGEWGPQQRWSAPKECATVEEMGRVAVGNTAQASLDIRRLIHGHLLQHGATKLRQLSEDEFCRRGFVMGKGQHDGLGNNLYKILTGAALAIMLNRSIIIGETGPKALSATHPEYVSQRKELMFPFSNYLRYSPEMISMQEAKQLWVRHGCASRHGRPFRMRVDYFSRIKSSKVLCEDWTAWEQPVIWFAEATDSVGLQWFLKNRHWNMRDRAMALLGRPWLPDSRANLFGELAHALLSPQPVVERAIRWTLKHGKDPDVVLHLRHGRMHNTIEAGIRCVSRLLGQFEGDGAPRVAVVSDTPGASDKVAELLGRKAQVLKFDFNKFVQQHPNISIMSSSYFAAPAKRVEDWGPLPRWVAIVEFFLAARARFGLVSGGGSRVATTFAQLAAALAAAKQLRDDGVDGGFSLYSSFQATLLEHGLLRQSGRGYTWHTFGGPLSCPAQPRQCAATPLLPYAWWDGPWQSPIGRQVRKLQAAGLLVASDGEVGSAAVEGFCVMHSRGDPTVVDLALPACKDVAICKE